MTDTNALADVGTSLEQIVDLIKVSGRADAIELLRGTLTLERGAGFIDGMKHMDNVTRKTLDAITAGSGIALSSHQGTTK